MTPGAWVAVAGVVIALAGLVATGRRNRGLDRRGMHEQINTLGQRITALETKVDVFWRSVAFPAASALHSPHPEFARRDALLEALMDGRLDLAGAAELAGMVEQVRDDEAAPTVDRLAAGQVLGYLTVKYLDGGVL